MVLAVLTTVVLVTPCLRALIALSNLVRRDPLLSMAPTLATCTRTARVPAVVLVTKNWVNANVPMVIPVTIVAVPFVLTIVLDTVNVLLPKTFLPWATTLTTVA